MKTDILLFTQTMHSLLSSSLPLQSSLAICEKILTGKGEKKFTVRILKKVSEGKKLSAALFEEKLFSSLYVSLVSIGEESGTLAQVFGHLALYLCDKKNMKRKFIQALLYPAFVLLTAIAVVLVLILFVMPRLEIIFEAFANSSDNIRMQMNRIKYGSFVTIGIMICCAVVTALCFTAHKISSKAAFIIDDVLLKLPVIKDFIMTMQMHDFSFAMKLLTQTHFPLLESLDYAKDVMSNFRIKKAVNSVCKNITEGCDIGKSFEREKLFPKYLAVWVKIAEENGKTQDSFSQIFNYYQNESENILTGLTQAAEPVFILLTGALIIAIIAQFVIPVFNLLGTL